jgi:Dolichyl-phosphate-mannose-protein mannosyltransferase
MPRIALPATALGRARAGLMLVVIAATAGKLVMAATTYGQNDVNGWLHFAAAVARAGPVGIYKLDIPGRLYNHPPLVGYLLEVVDFAVRRGMSFPFAIRLPAIMADVVTPFLVLELLRKRRPLLRSFAAATSVAVSPVLIIISGFHGNNDPIFVMFCLLSVYLLVDRQAPALAGLAIAIALGIKIVPIVVVPALLVYAFRTGWRSLYRFCLASGVFLVLTWGPVLVRVWEPFRAHVLGYTGSVNFRVWGLIQLGIWAGSPSWMTWLEGTGRFVVVLIAAGIPAALVLRRPARAVEACGLALAMLLLLSPAFGPQYLVWALAPSYLLTFWGATAFNVAAGALLIEVYTRWSGGFPWYFAKASLLTQGERVAAIVVWAILLGIVALGVRLSLERDPT